MTESFFLQWARPEWLGWLILAIPILIWFHFRSLSDFPRWQRFASLVIRLCIVVLILLSLVGLVLLRPTDRQMVVVAMDQSKSIDGAAANVADEFARQLMELDQERDDVEIRFLPFDSEPGKPSSDWNQDAESENPEIAAGRSDDRAVGRESAEEDSGLGTSIAAAIRTSIASIPPSYVPSVVVVSDGNETSGNCVAAAASSGVPVHAFALPQRSEPEIQVAAVNVPAQVRQGEPFFVEVVVNSNRDAKGYIDLFRGDIKVGDSNAKPMQLKPGENRFRVRQSVSRQRQIVFAARLRGFGDADTLLDNNESSAILVASGRPRILLIDPDTEQTDSIRWALDEQKIDVEVRPPEGIPQDLAELQAYECLVLSNTPATSMSMRQMDVIRSYVQDLGGGLVMLGGDQSFGLGGYYRTQLEEILPVRSNFEKEREKPSLAMVLVIDKSGSMGGEKIELAKDAARAAVELLGPRDSIGVIAFDGSPYWVSELRGSSDKSYVMDQISTIQASGGTAMHPAMENAYEALDAASAKLKHCILLTDGVSAPGDFEGLAGDMAANGMTVSTVALGQGASEQLLEDIARIGKGRYYFCDDPQSVPQVFAKETIEASKSAINELPFLPQLVRPTQVLEGIDLELSPLLLGYVVTRPKPTSEFILASESGDPLLVWWRYGLGMTVAFTSDAKSRWAAEWLSWPDFGPFWAQIIRHAMRKNHSRGIFVEVETSHGRTTVAMDTVDDQGAFINDAPTQLTVIDPRMETLKLEMPQVAPGRYEVAFATSKRGSYQMDLSQSRLGGGAVRQSRGLVVGYPDELRLLPTDEEKLRAMSSVSGGVFNPTVEQVVESHHRRAREAVALWPYLLISAIVLFVIDVGLRRIELTGA